MYIPLISTWFVSCNSVFMYMMDSMTDAELDGKVDIEHTPSRVASEAPAPVQSRC